MAFEEVKVIDPYVEKGWTAELKLTLATPAEVEALEANLNVPMPVGYKEYVTMLGLGNYCYYIRIDMPSKILSDYEEYRGFLEKYWFWGNGKRYSYQRKGSRVYQNRRDNRRRCNNLSSVALRRTFCIAKT